MALKIRLARGGAKKRPFYRIVVAEASSPRDGRYVERLGTYNPMVPKDHDQRLNLNTDRIKYWLGEGAQPTERVEKMLASAKLVRAPVIREQPKKSAPGKKRLEREAEAEQKKLDAAEATRAANKAAAEAAKAEAAKPAEEKPAEPATGDAEAAAADAAPADAEAKGEDAKPAEQTTSPPMPKQRLKMPSPQTTSLRRLRQRPTMQRLRLRMPNQTPISPRTISHKAPTRSPTRMNLRSQEVRHRIGERHLERSVAVRSSYSGNAKSQTVPRL